MNSNKLKEFNEFLMSVLSQHVRVSYHEYIGEILQYIIENHISDQDISNLFNHYAKKFVNSLKKHPSNRTRLTRAGFKDEIFPEPQIKRKEVGYSFKSKEDEYIYNLFRGLDVLIKTSYIPSLKQFTFFAGDFDDIDTSAFTEYDDMTKAAMIEIFLTMVYELKTNLENLDESLSKIATIPDIINIVSEFTDKDIQRADKLFSLYDELVTKYPNYNYMNSKYLSELVEMNKARLRRSKYFHKIVAFKSLSKSECLKKLKEFNSQNEDMPYGSDPRVKNLCEQERIGKNPQKKFGLRSFQQRERNEELEEKKNEEQENEESDKESEESSYCSKTHMQEQTMMSVNFNSTFGAYHCSSVNMFVSEDETSQKIKIGSYLNSGDIYIKSDTVTLNPNSWSKDFPCYKDFHNGKPFFIKLGTYGHIFCAFIFPKTQECEIWDTGTTHNEDNRIISGILKEALPKGYKILLVNTQVQGRLEEKYRKRLSTEKIWVDSYCQTWIYLYAYLRLVLNYTPTEIILYLLSLNFRERSLTINAFHTQLANNGDALKYLDVVQDMIKKGWKNRFENIYENINLAFDYEEDEENDEDVPDRWEKNLQILNDRLGYIFESSVSGKKYNVDLRSKSTSGTFEDYFWVDYSKLKLQFNAKSHIETKDLNTLKKFFNPQIKGGSGSAKRSVKEKTKRHYCSKCKHFY